MFRTVNAFGNYAAQFTYSFEPEDKKYIKAICKLSERAQARLEVSELWVHPENILFGKSLDWREEETIMILKRSKFFDGMYGMVSKQIERISKLKQLPEVFATGDSYSGHLCLDDQPASTSSFYCRVWRTIDLDTIVVGSKHGNDGQPHAEVLRQINDSIDGSLSKLAE